MSGRRIQIMAQNLIVSLSNRRLPDSIGTKARNLCRLKNKGYRVPETYVCLWDAHSAYIQDDLTLVDRLLEELKTIIHPERLYAVRSSANIEDGEDFSFAGQFKSMLSMCGTDQVLQAIWAIWSSTQGSDLRSYLGKTSLSQHTLRMAVIIQEMVNPVVSGVSFSKNPITSLDEIVVEAVHGRGDLLMQEGVTPFRWVNKWGSWVDQPSGEPILAELIEEVVEKTRQIAGSFKKDVDLEWVYDGQDLYWVQLRDITSLKVGNIYSNRISKEMIPGLIKPLVWSVAVPTHSALWLQILRDLVGKNDINLSDMIHAFHYRAYFNVTVFGEVFNRVGMPRESLEMMMGLVPPNVDKPHFRPKPGMIPLIPRLVWFLWNYAHFDRHAKKALPKLETDFQFWSEQIPSQKDEKELLVNLDQIRDLYKQVAHFTIIVQLMMFIYNRMLKSRLEKLGVDFQSFDLTEGMTDLKRFDPNFELSALKKEFLELGEDAQAVIKTAGLEEFLSIPDLQSFQAHVMEFLQKFGHLSESAVDFSYRPWRENPDFVIRMLIEHEDLREPETVRIQFKDLPPSGQSSRLTKSIFMRARLFRYYREAYSSLFSRSLGFLRAYYLALADLWVMRGILKDREDIFYLFHDELQAVFQADLQPGDVHSLVLKRRQGMKDAQDIPTPEIIFGDTPPPIIPGAKEKLVGVPTSRGYYVGPVKVVRNFDEFNKLLPGDVLVIPYSDTAWLPLFTKAGAVIAESGGMLSHSSIIAREYNIPAVVSVPGALCLTDHTLVSVDGYKGEIQIINS